MAITVKKKNITLLFTILISMVGIRAFAYDLKVENADGVILYYNYSADGTELSVTSGYTGCYKGDIVIPEDVTYMNRTRKVTSIGERAFYRCEKLYSVALSNSITTIERDAFYQCYELTSITFSNSLTTIGKQAFMYCSGLTSITLPPSLTAIDEAAFYWCSGLISITIPSSVSFIGGFAFHCDNMSEVISKIENPFKIYGKGKSSYQTFHPNTFNNATLYVPAGTKEKYMTTDGWKDFLYITEDDSSDIKTVAIEKASGIVRYTFDGKRINEPQGGVNIVRMNDGTTKKVVVK